jgi:hypothetical protein
LEYFTVIWFILWPFGNVVVIWYIFVRFGILCQEQSGNPDHQDKTFPRKKHLGGSPQEMGGLTTQWPTNKDSKRRQGDQIW